MPSMTHYAYFAPLVASVADVWAYQRSTSEKITAFVNECAGIGLKRGLHYTLTPLSKADLCDIIAAPEFKPVCRIPAVEIKFRSARHLKAAVSSGIVQHASGSEEERPIWE